MELRHLRHFVAVAEELHFTRAAARLHLAQPPLSQSIHRLEAELGLKLFERTKRRVVLTEAGNVFLEEARVILARADEAVRRAKRASRGEVGYLNIGVIPWAELSPTFSKIVRIFNQRRPNVRLDFHGLSTPEHPLAIEDGRIDIGFFAPLAPPSNFAHELIVSEPIVAALSERHALCQHRIVPLKMLAMEPHILVARDRISSYYDLITSLYRDIGYSVRVVHETDHPMTTLARVSAQVGVSLVPASFKNLRWPGITYRPVRPSAKVCMIAAWRAGDNSSVLSGFIEVMQDVVRQRRRK